mmetsp:Transcript_5668/g.23991  ORF Transcript_5668/g.23991 Transcript_5668/m.23991 type:complete len:133 (-) Transcript_5668:110-508(-)
MPAPKAPVAESPSGVGVSRDNSDVMSSLQPIQLDTNRGAGERNESTRQELQPEVGSSSLVEDGSEETIGSPLDSGGPREGNRTTSGGPEVDVGFTNEAAESTDLMPVTEAGESKLQANREGSVVLDASAEAN